MDRRQLAVLQGEVGRVGEHHGVDQEGQQDPAHAARPVLPDRRERREAEQNGKNPARPSAPKNVASAGFISRKPKRTMRIETITATTEKIARLRDQVARLDTGSD